MSVLYFYIGKYINSTLRSNFLFMLYFFLDFIYIFWFIDIYSLCIPPFPIFFIIRLYIKTNYRSRKAIISKFSFYKWYSGSIKQCYMYFFFLYNGYWNIVIIYENNNIPISIMQKKMYVTLLDWSRISLVKRKLWNYGFLFFLNDDFE